MEKRILQHAFINEFEFFVLGVSLSLFYFIDSLACYSLIHSFSLAHSLKFDIRSLAHLLKSDMHWLAH
jgi:hypothetical protein